MSKASPLLVVIAGPARGWSVPLTGSLSIGRDEGNTLVIGDLALSRRHCEIACGEGEFVLRDLQSLNGSFVNERPVVEHRLQDGDRISIGDSALVFVDAPRAREFAAWDLADPPVDANSTVVLHPAHSRYLGAVPPAATGDRAARDLFVLVRFSETAQQASAWPALRDALLEAARDALAADGIAIVGASAGSDELDIEGATSPPGRSLIVSRTLVRRTVQEGVAILAGDLASDARFRDAPSVAASPVRGALCVPLTTGAAGNCVLYVVRHAGAFGEADLHLAAALGRIAGLARDRVRAFEGLEEENRTLREAAGLEHELLGESPRLKSVIAMVARVAPTESTVLVRGESGTGKELVARAIHANSPRASGPFIAINCAALPEPLLESELFGHERGAFTGALSQQRGRLELAHGGTVFLDEIGELAPALQAKLLRVLQDRVVERLGARRGVPIDVRIVAATNRDLEAAIIAGALRQDLFYRLNVVSIDLPPLRERADDVPLLARYFLRKHAARCKRVVRSISPEAKKLLMAYRWPGNVRELENAIERAVVLGSTDVIHVDDLPEAILERPAEGSAEGYHDRVAEQKRTIIREALERARGNVAQAARDLGLQPTYLHRLIRNLGVRDGLRADR